LIAYKTSEIGDDYAIVQIKQLGYMFNQFLHSAKV
jgi:hypothetical protein